MNKPAKRIGFRKPQNKIEWAMWIGVGITLLAFIFNLFFLKKPKQPAPTVMTPVYIIHFLKSIGLAFIGTAMLTAGVARLKKDPQKTRAYLMIIGAVLLFSAMIGRPAISSNRLSIIQADNSSYRERLIENLTQTLSNRSGRLSSADKAHLRKIIAQEKYFLDGSLTEYVDEKGITVKYQPTNDDARKRKAFLILPQRTRILRTETAFWIIVFIVTLGGSFVYYRKPPE